MKNIDLRTAARRATPLRSAALFVALLAVPGALTAPALAAPDLSTLEIVEGLTVVGDRENSGLFYYFPGSIGLAVRDDGGPDLTFTVASYTGSVVRDDRGERFVRANLYARVEMDVPSHHEVRTAELAIRARHGNGAHLRPIPVARLDAELVHTRLGDDSSDPGDETLGTGFFEPRDADGRAGALWRERDVYLTLDPRTAEILEAQLRSGGAGLSLSYAFFARAWTGADDQGELSASGDPEIAEEIAGALETSSTASTGTTSTEEPPLELLSAEAIPIRIPAEFREDRLRRYFLDAMAPPSYASLIVYCYDFRDSEREELFEKTIEIVAQGIGGGDTVHRAVFDADSPDVYARTVRFPFAVDLREPYQWRVQEIHWSGETIQGEWRDGGSWAEILDASGPVAEELTEGTKTDATDAGGNDQVPS